MKRSITAILFMVSVLLAFIMGMFYGGSKNDSLLSPVGQAQKELPLLEYSFENLAARGGVHSEIKVEGDKFYFTGYGKRISGQIKKPEGTPKGIVVMARGYVDKEIYQTGMGTKNAAAFYSKNGYITYAPDFSGYGESDDESTDVLEARLAKPAEILDLLASFATDLPIYLWGHSNGGQIMLSVAEILGMREPITSADSQVRGVTLWAPVSKPFPYSVLYYTDEASDSGKWLRGQIAKLEQDYDVYNYSVDRYLDKINIPLQIHQGSADEAVPMRWSNQLVESLNKLDKEVRYYTYPGADHNMRPVWNTVVERDLEFVASIEN